MVVRTEKGVSKISSHLPQHHISPTRKRLTTYRFTSGNHKVSIPARAGGPLRIHRVYKQRKGRPSSHPEQLALTTPAVLVCGGALGTLYSYNATQNDVSHGYGPRDWAYIAASAALLEQESLRCCLFPLGSFRPFFVSLGHSLRVPARFAAVAG